LVATALEARPQRQQSSNSLVAHRPKSLKQKLQHGVFSPQRENSEERLVATALEARPQRQQSNNSLVAHRRKSLKQKLQHGLFSPQRENSEERPRKEKTAKSDHVQYNINILLLYNNNLSNHSIFHPGHDLSLAVWSIK
jgi:hypothetical protein